MAPVHRYQALIDHITGTGDDELILTLAEIEHLIGVPLPPSATNHPSYWRHTGNALPRALRAHGWHATLQVEHAAVTFSRSARNPTARPSRLDPLLVFLATQENDCFRLSFDQLKELFGGYLVRAARIDPAWWDGREPHARKWEALGWNARLDIRGRAVEFRRVGEG